MKKAIVLGGQNSLDFSEIRMSVVRIPEVSLKIEQAQKHWDECCKQGFSFQHFITSDDNFFYNSISLKSLSLAIVQLGLIDRYNRLFGKPDYIVGNIENDSAVSVAIGKISLKDLIVKSPASGVARPLSPLKVANESSDIQLNGRSLPKYQAFKLKQFEGQIEISIAEPFGEIEMSLSKVLQNLVDKEDVKNIVNVGPGHMHRSDLRTRFEACDIHILESIDIDPMLGWFWQGLRHNEHYAEIAQ